MVDKLSSCWIWPVLVYLPYSCESLKVRQGVRKETSPMRKHGGMDFPLICCTLSAIAVMKVWAGRSSQPWGGEQLGGRGRPALPLSCSMPLLKLKKSVFCQRPRFAETVFIRGEKGEEQNGGEKKHVQFTKKSTTYTSPLPSYIPITDFSPRVDWGAHSTIKEK